MTNAACAVRGVVLALSIGTCVCSSPVRAQVQRPSAASPVSQFDAELFRIIVSATPDKNVFISPLSAYVASAMAYDGASGTTREAIARTLGLSAAEEASLDRDVAERLRAMVGDRETTVSIANSFWAMSDLPVEPSYVRALKATFHADVMAADLSSPATVERINRWVSRATHDRIPHIVDEPLPKSTVAVLFNAVYFKGSWANAFDVGRTAARPFYREDGTVVSRPAMQHTEAYAYVREPGFQALRIPYRGGRFSMTVILPDSGTPLTRVTAALALGSGSSWMDSLRPTQVFLQLPKFRMKYRVDLVKPLTAMGMGVAFDADHANFGRMLPRGYLERNNAFVGKVWQETFVEVTEKGTEAAAATGMAIPVSKGSVMSMSFVVDRPFVFIIRDDRSGTVLFIGHITDPAMD